MKKLFKWLSSIDGSAVCIAAMVLTLVGVTVMFIQALNEQNKVMKQQNCQRTNTERTYFMPQYTFGANGAITSTILVPVTEYYYMCDDHPRWM